jgi:Na+-transporting NADH:ubiquinone oxidoreductase subunit F
VVFTLIILAMVAMLVGFGRMLSEGEVLILINDDKEKSPTVPAGGTLLASLAGSQIFLPSACGGGGTCAMCKCQVFEGGGDILPTETTHISRAQADDHWRLACQVKVKENMKIKVPDEVFGVQKFNCTVRSNDNVATFIKEFLVDLDEGKTLKFQAGGYIQIDIPAYEGIKYRDFDVDPKYHADWDKFNVWRYVANNPEPCFRAYSMANHPAEGNQIMLNVRIATPPPGDNDIPPGIASSYVWSRKPGDKVVISGPFGEFFLKKRSKREIVFIGGGAGMAPMRSHIFNLFHTRKTRRKVSFWYGARSKQEMFYDEHFRDIEKDFPNFTYHVGLSSPLPEDNWTGKVGFIHQVVHDHYLADHPDPAEIEYYLCGPPLMLSAVQKMLYDLGVERDMIAFDEF